MHIEIIHDTFERLPYDPRFGEISVVGLCIAPESRDDFSGLIQYLHPDDNPATSDWKVCFSQATKASGIDRDTQQLHLSSTRLIDAVHKKAHKEKKRPIEIFQTHIGEYVVAQALRLPDELIEGPEPPSRLRPLLLGVGISGATMVGLYTAGEAVLDRLGEIASTPAGLAVAIALGLWGPQYIALKDKQVAHSQYDQFRKFRDQNASVINGLNATIRPVFSNEVPAGY